MNIELKQMLSKGYTENLTELDMEEVRIRRLRSQEMESALSFIRRIAQGRLDLVIAEIEGADHARNLQDVISTRITGGKGGHSTAWTRNSEILCEALIDELAEKAYMDQNSLSLPKEELTRLAAKLQNYEKEVSIHRHTLHMQIDKLQKEIVRRHIEHEIDITDLINT